MSTFDSMELTRYSDDSNRDSDDRVVGECTPMGLCSYGAKHKTKTIFFFFAMEVG